MNPANFPESNTVMTRPANMTAEQCMDIHAFRDGKCVVTCWTPTPSERVRLAMGEPVYLYIVGATMPPVLLTVDSPFEAPTPAPAPAPHPWGATREQVITYIRDHLTDGLPSSLKYLEDLAKMQEAHFWPHVTTLWANIENCSPPSDGSGTQPLRKGDAA